MQAIGLGLGLAFGGIASGNLAASLAASLLGAETQGLAVDFTDMSMVIKDTGTPANNFSGDPNNKLTYTSPSTKWVLGANGLYSSGTTMRTSYDANGNKLGVLIEEARTNVALFSNAFSDASWAKDNISLSTPSVTSLFGAATTPLLTPSASTAQHRVIATGVATTGSQAISYFVRPNGYTKVAIREGVTTGAYASFNLTGSGVVLDQSAGTGSVTAYPGGWYRITLVATVTGTCRADLWILDPAYTTGFVIGHWAGDGSSGVYIDNAQVEAGAFVTSPIITAGSTVTRAVDNISLGEASFPNSTSTMLLMARFSAAALGTSRYSLVYGNAASTEYMALRQDTSNFMRAITFTAGVAQSSQTDSVAESSGFDSLAVSVATNNVLAAKNGALLAAADTSATVPNPDTLYFGQFTPGGNIMNAYLSKVLVLPRAAVSQAELNGIAA